jgi:predicted membrane-bound mannosyltransferase
MTVYTLILTILYCAIPYKTPWCALSFLHGYIVLAGAGIGYVVAYLRERSSRGPRYAGYAVLLLFTVWIGYVHTRQNLRACREMAADPRNPYVYAHTGTDAMELVASIEKAAESAQGFDTFIAIAVPTPDTWPLPWYLRKYKNVGYWTHVDQIPEGLEPVVIVAAADQGDVADERFGKDKQANFYGIRPGTLLNLFVPKE